jgi:hypothetical protein
MKLSYIIELDTLCPKFFGSTEFIVEERTDTYKYYTHQLIVTLPLNLLISSFVLSVLLGFLLAVDDYSLWLFLFSPYRVGVRSV